MQRTPRRADRAWPWGIELRVRTVAVVGPEAAALGLDEPPRRPVVEPGPTPVLVDDRTIVEVTDGSGRVVAAALATDDDLRVAVADDAEWTGAGDVATDAAATAAARAAAGPTR